MKNGGTDYIEKPIDVDILNVKINRSIEQNELLRTQQIAREKEDWRGMKNAIKMVTDTNHKHYVDVENVLRYWQSNNLEGIKAKCQQISTDNPRYQEAMYYFGLAQYHTGYRESAQATFKKAIDANRDSAWAHRLDLALGLVKLNPNTYLSALDTIPSELGRKYMCPNGIDDLAKR